MVLNTKASLWTLQKKSISTLGTGLVSIGIATVVSLFKCHRNLYIQTLVEDMGLANVKYSPPKTPYFYG